MGRWGAFCTPEVQEILTEVVETYVSNISKMVVKGSMVANEALLAYLRVGNVPDLTTTFFRQCMTGETTDPIIQQVLVQEFQQHPPIERKLGDGHVLNYSTNLYYTNFDNALWMHFETRVYNHVKDLCQVFRTGIDDDLESTIRAFIFGRQAPRPTVLQKDVWNFIDQERDALENPQPFYVESARTDLLLKYMYRMLEFKSIHHLHQGFSLALLVDKHPNIFLKHGGSRCLPAKYKSSDG